MKKLELGTIEKALTASDRHVLRAAVFACQAHKYDSALSNKWRESDSIGFRLGECFLHRDSPVPIKHINAVIGLLGEENELSLSADIGKKLLILGLRPKCVLENLYPPEIYEPFYSSELFLRNIATSPISTYTVKKNLNSDVSYKNVLGLYSIPRLSIDERPFYNDLIRFLDYMDNEVKEAAIYALRAANVTPSTIISNYSKANSITKRISWMRIAAGRKDVCLPLIPEEMDASELPFVSGLYIGNKKLDEWALKGTEKERAAAAYSLIGETNPTFVLLNRLYRDCSPLVHDAALILAGQHGFPPFREVAVPERVYKKCVGDVIIEAIIPEDAEVRGDLREQCRSNKAIITNVIGSYIDEKVGISFYDGVTQYRKGDIVEVKNFDYSRAECTEGFHFFCNYNLARKYYY